MAKVSTTKEDEFLELNKDYDFLDKKLGEVFGGKSKVAVRVAIWNYYMGKNEHNTLATLASVKDLYKKPAGDVKDFVKTEVLA